MKKILKKSLACMLAAILCLTACVGAMASVGAEGAITYSIADVAIAQGAEGVIDVTVSNFADVAGLIAEITLPDAVVSIDGVKLNDSAELVEMTDETAGHYVVNGKTVKFVGLFNSLNEFGDALANVDTLEINIAVTVADDAEVKDYDFAAPIFQAGSEYEQLIDAVAGNVGKLTVTCAHIEVIDAAVAPTCTETGLTEGKHCSKCNEVIVAQETVDALGHTEAEAVIENNVDPDCVNAGSYDTVVYCTVCNEEISRETVTVDALGHTAGDVVIENQVAADCDTEGSYDEVVYCTVCNEELSRETKTVDALGHTEAEAVIENNVAPDCVNPGSYDTVVYCTVCNEEISRVTTTVEALGHTEVIDAAVAPTCTETGLTEGSHCSVCGEVLVAQEVVPVIDHNYVDGKCDVCGADDPNYVPPVVGPEVNESIIPDLKIVISDTLGLGVFVTTAQLKDYDYYEIEVIQTKYDDDCNYKTAAAAVLRNTELSNGGSGKLYGRFMGVQMHGLALNMQVVIKCYKNDELVAVSNAFNTSMAQLAIAQFDSTSKATTKTLMSDLLVMGAEAEKYFAGRYPSSKLAEVVEEGNLCNKGFVGTPTEAVGELNTVEITEDGESDITNTLTLGVALSGAPAVSYLFQNKGLDKSKLVMELSYDCIYNNTGEITDVVTGDMWKTSGSYYTYNFTKTRMYDSNKTVTAKIYYDGKLVLTNQYSVETYVATRKTTSSAYNLCNAIAKFGAAARAYFPGS